jgi:hypothetical protein
LQVNADALEQRCAAGLSIRDALAPRGGVFVSTPAPTRRGKLPETIGAEVWLALAPTCQPAPPLNSPGAAGGDSYRFLSFSSRGNLHADFTSEDAGKTAHYALRWLSTTGERGP